MLRLLSISDMSSLVKLVGIKDFFCGLVQRLQDDYAQWQTFDKAARVVFKAENGVLELMPILGPDYFAFKYVNGHPNNPQRSCLTVVATGQLADVASGYPVLISEMTLLTAFRTAAVAAMVAAYSLPDDFDGRMLLYGAGAQAAFLVLAHAFICGVQHVYCIDPDASAVARLKKQMQAYGIVVEALTVADSVLASVRLIVTATAAPRKQQLFAADVVAPGTHINALGGDGAGKTELDPQLLSKADIIVQYAAQTRVEGEIQNKPDISLHAAVWELCAGCKQARSSADSIVVFDSVGFALEDYSSLLYVYEQATQHAVGQQLDMLPEGCDPKDLFSYI